MPKKFQFQGDSTIFVVKNVLMVERIISIKIRVHLKGNKSREIEFETEKHTDMELERFLKF